MRLLAEEAFYRFLDLGHARHPTHEDDLIYTTFIYTSILHALLAGVERASYQVCYYTFELGLAQLDIEMFRARRVGRDER